MLNKRTLLNLALLLALAALALLVIYEPGREAAPEMQPITRLAAADIRQIRLQRPGRADLELKRVGTQWIIVGTPEYPAAEFQVHSLLPLAEAPAIRRYAAQDLDLDRVGLTASASRVTFNQDTQILFGATDPLDDNRYVQVGEQVSLIQNRYQHLLEGDLEQWISRRLLPRDSHIEAIELPDLRLQQTDAGQWQLAPEQPDIDSDAIVTLVEHWQQAQAVAVHLRQGDVAAGQRVRIQLQGHSEPLEFHILEDGDDRLFVRTDLQLEYRLGAYQAAELLHFTTPLPPGTP